LTSWLTELAIDKVTQTPLLHLAFESLSSEELFDSTVDFIVAMFAETREVFDNPGPIKLLYDELCRASSSLGALETDPDIFRGIVSGSCTEWSRQHKDRASKQTNNI